MQFQGRTFHNETVELDGNDYDRCDIQHCTLIYRGGKIPSLTNSTVAHCQFTFEDSALNTIAFLRAFYQGGFHPIVDDVFNNIRTP